VRRLFPLIVVLTLAGAGCSGSDDLNASPSGETAPTTTVTTPSVGATTETLTPSPSLVVDADVRLPVGMPAVVDDPTDLAGIEAGELTSLVPAGTSITSQVWTVGAVVGSGPVPNAEIAIAWFDEGTPRRSSGLIVWQRFEDESWHAVYAFTDPPRKGVFGIRLDTGELTGDAIADVLSFEDVGGSGACGTYRVIASTAGDASEIFRRDTCDTQIAIAGRDLRIREAVFHAGDPHCCPSAFRESTLRWNGTSWDEVSSQVVPNDPAGR
jgi:hypothetical protein